MWPVACDYKITGPWFAGPFHFTIHCSEPRKLCYSLILPCAWYCFADSSMFWHILVNIVQRYLSNIVHFPFRKLFIPQVYGLIQELCISSSKDWLTWNLSNPVVKILPPKCGGYRFDSYSRSSDPTYLIAKTPEHKQQKQYCEKTLIMVHIKKQKKYFKYFKNWLTWPFYFIVALK